jgi:REP element-mobilizing transposase RayT
MQRNASTDELYFVTLTVVDWIDVFTRRYYSDFIIENLAWCQQNANLNTYAYVIMINHIHMVANVTDGSLGDVLGRFKSFTSKELYKMIAGNVQESRREWMLKAFDRAGKNNPFPSPQGLLQGTLRCSMQGITQGPLRETLLRQKHRRLIKRGRLDCYLQPWTFERAGEFNPCA